ncbi:metallo-dependent phosphatase-like [Desulfoluna butyratoxydans]|uniref:Metallo-dependent phosphatase-like n=2 Tax=Desulfoluna butyratoxydans TaxID=231438 RepID=A0A4U8YNA3_9BACT|nr:metallo-dependent phosphatase-like [Desulfoluna butyratoxydans]
MSLFILFLVVSISVFIWFGGIRFFNQLPLPVFIRFLLWMSLFYALFFSPLLFYLRTLGQKGPLFDAMAWVGYLLMGIYSILICGVMARDLAGALISLLPFTSTKGHAAMALPFVPARRGFLINGINLAIAGSTATLAGLALKGGLKAPEVVTVTHPAEQPGLKGLRIVQISDLHVSHTIRRGMVERVVSQVSALSPDMVVFTGDLVDGSVAMLRDDVAPLADLAPPMGKYFITGNHEYYSGVRPWLDEVARLGFTTLLNSHLTLNYKGAPLVLAGVTDYHAGRLVPEHASSPKQALSGAPEDAYRILLAHQPLSFTEAKAQNCHLTLSGHTHGGQYLPYTWVIHAVQPWVAGLYEEDGHRLYINRGTGFWGPPFRLGSPSEITLHLFS